MRAALTPAVGSAANQRWYPVAPGCGDAARIVSRAERRLRLAREQSRPVPFPFHILSTDIGLEVARHWAEPCEAAFEYIMTQRPVELAHLIEESCLAPGDLTFAAEVLGQSDDGDLVRKTLLPLLSHPEAVVREGAIYGISRHLDASIRDELRRLVVGDGSEAVRTAAQDALEE